MGEVVIKIENLYKKYRLGSIGGGTLTADLQSWWARTRGKEDPNLKIGEKQYSKNETFMALNGINLEINKGDTIGIIGGNGAGKSTMLKLLSRVTAPTEGSIKIKGRISSMLEVGTGFHGELTGRENIYLNGAILGMTKAEVDKKIDDIIKFSECEKFIDTPVKRYSSGMYVKLAFAVAAHLDSEILVMDEVLAVGDMKFQQKCLGKMGDVAETEGKTVLYVSHNMNTIQQLCNRVIVMDHGKIIFDGDVEEGIKIYMDNTKEMEVFNDLREISRKEHVGITEKIKAESIELVGKNNCIYTNKEKIKMNLKYEIIKPIDEIFISFIVKYADKTRIGRAQNSTPIDSKVCGINNEIIELDTRNLAPGKYLIDLVMYSVNQYGTKERHDVVSDAFAFEIQLVEGEINNMQWSHKGWGHINFNELKISSN